MNYMKPIDMTPRYTIIDGVPHRPGFVTPLTIEERVRAQETPPPSLTGKLIWAGLSIADTNRAYDEAVYIGQDQTNLMRRLRSVFGEVPAYNSANRKQFSDWHPLWFTNNFASDPPVIYQLEGDGLRLYYLNVDNPAGTRRNFFVRIQEITLRNLVRQDLGIDDDGWNLDHEGTWILYQQEMPHEFIESIEHVCGKPIGRYRGTRLLPRADPHNKMGFNVCDLGTFPTAFYMREGTNSDKGYSLFVAIKDKKAFFRIMQTQELADE